MTMPQSRLRASRLANKGRHLAVVLAVLIGGVGVLSGLGFVLLCVVKGLWWIGNLISSYVGNIGWGIGALLVCLAVQETLSRLKQPDDAAVAPTVSGARRARKRPILCAAAAAVLISGNLSLNIAASRVEEHWKSRRQEGVDIYKNHDLAKLVGRCVRLAVLRHAQSVNNTIEREALEAIAAIAPEQWGFLTEAKDYRVVSLADANLTEFIREPRTMAQAEWQSMLRDWRKITHSEAVTDETLAGAADTVAADFGITLREALKADFESGGKAWAAMQLNVAQALLNRTPVGLGEGDPAIKSTLDEVRSLLADDAVGLPALRTTILNVRQAQEAHAREVAANFDQVVGMLTNLRAGVEAILSNQADFGLILQISIDPLISPEQKQTQILAQLEPIINNRPAIAPRVQVPATVQQAVARTFAGAPKIVRFAALARVGLDIEADSLAAEIERTTAGLSESDKYDFFVARGDRYWLADDFWKAATWYGQAMASRVDAPGVVYRATMSILSAPGTASHLQDVQLAQSWVERCLANLEGKVNPNDIVRAKLLATLGFMLARQGKVGEAVACARRSLSLFAALRDLPAAAIWYDLSAAATTLSDAGQWPEASVATDRAMKAASASGGDDSGAVALVACACAHIRARRDLEVGEADIKKCIDWLEAQYPPNDGGLAIAYVSRASIRETRGNLSGAEADLKKSLEWLWAQAPRDDWGLADRYVSRARIRFLRGDLAGADADIKNAIDWYEAQSPRDDRRLAISYLTRAMIRPERGDLAGAEDDIKKGIEWLEAQSPRDERSLAVAYGEQAEIRLMRGDLAGAEADINKTIDWFGAQESREDWNLADGYVKRAWVRRVRGDLAGAEADIRNGINWYEGQAPRDERRLAIAYSSRATIREERGDLAGAEADIQKTIEWEESQSPRDERSLSGSFYTRASIRLVRGDLDGAEVDITKCIKWEEAQSPRDERRLSSYYFRRANILRFRGPLASAEADIKKSIDWEVAQSPRDEQKLAVDYALRAGILRNAAIILRNRGDAAGAAAHLRDARTDIEAALKWFCANRPNDELQLRGFRQIEAGIDASEQGR